MIKRLIDRNHNGYALLVDILRMLQPAETRNCVMHWGQHDVFDAGSPTGANASPANPTPSPGLGALGSLEDSNSRARRWVYESVDAPTDTPTHDGHADHPTAVAELEPFSPVASPQQP
jgi:hypothetical protein